MTFNIEKNHPRWNQMWQNGIKPGERFDTGIPSPILIQYFNNGLLPEGRALVPGCGRGYDVTLLASPNRYVLGLDISEIAINEAKLRYESLDETIKPPSDKIEFSTLNFFDLDINDDCKFNLVYDYTFLCALDPSIRVNWAKKMSEIIKKDGMLFSVIFPIQSEDLPGPPFSVSLELYKELLIPVGFKCIKLENLPPELSHSGRDGTGPMPRNSGLGIFIRL